MGKLLKNSQRNNGEVNKLREEYLYFCKETLTSFYDIFREMHKEKGFEPSLEINQEVWLRCMYEIFANLTNCFLYDESKIKEIDRIAAQLFFSKIKNHNLSDGNKRSAVLAVIIHYVAYRAVVEKIYDKKIDLDIKPKKMYKKAKKIAEIDSQEINDEKIIDDLEKWFNRSGSSNFISQVLSVILFFKKQ